MMSKTRDAIGFNERLVRETFPGRALVLATEAGKFLGLAPATTRALYARGQFPLRTTRSGKFRQVLVADIIRHLDSLEAQRQDR